MVDQSVKAQSWLNNRRDVSPQSVVVFRSLEIGSEALLPLVDLPRAPHQPQRKVYFGAIHVVLTLQKKYCYAGWFRIKEK